MIAAVTLSCSPGSALVPNHLECGPRQQCGVAGREGARVRDDVGRGSPGTNDVEIASPSPRSISRPPPAAQIAVDRARIDQAIVARRSCPRPVAHTKRGNSRESAACSTMAHSEPLSGQEVVCDHCGEPVEPGVAGTTVSSDGEYLHNACVDAWARS